MSSSANAALGAGSVGATLGNLNAESGAPLTTSLTASIGTKALADYGITPAEVSDTSTIFDTTVGDLGSFVTDIADIAVELSARALRKGLGPIAGSFSSLVGHLNLSQWSGVPVINIWGIEPWGAGSHGVVLVGQKEMDDYNKKHKGK